MFYIIDTLYFETKVEQKQYKEAFEKTLLLNSAITYRWYTATVFLNSQQKQNGRCYA